MFKSKNTIRDIALIVLFIWVSKTALERTLVHIQEEQPTSSSIKTKVHEEVHELDKSFLVSLEETKKQIDIAIDLSGKYIHDKNQLEQLQAMQKEVKQIEDKFKKNSPATFLLGPLGTTAIVLKEKKLEQQLIRVMGDLGKILYTLQGSQEDYNIEIASVEQGLAKNKNLLEYIT